MKTYNYQYVRRRLHIDAGFTVKYVKKRCGLFVPNKRWYVGQKAIIEVWNGQLKVEVAHVLYSHILTTTGRYYLKSMCTPINPGR
jgi:hypothetical protein